MTTYANLYPVPALFDDEVRTMLDDLYAAEKVQRRT